MASGSGNKRKKSGHGGQSETKRGKGNQYGSISDPDIPGDLFDITEDAINKRTSCPIKTFQYSRERMDRILKSDFQPFIEEHDKKGHFIPGLLKIVPAETDLFVCQDFKRKMDHIEVGGSVKIVSASQIPHDAHERLTRAYMTSETNLTNVSVNVKGFYALAKGKLKKGVAVEVNSDTKLTPELLQTMLHKFWEHLCEGSYYYVNDLNTNGMDRAKSGTWFFDTLKTMLDDETIFREAFGIASSYVYFGTKFSHFPSHCEDVAMFSINILLVGKSKIWWAIPQYHGPKYEKLVRTRFAQEFGSNQTCRDFLRHKNVLIHPYELTNAGIDWDWTEQQQGQIIITGPYGYHFGFNTGDNASQAVNFATPCYIPFGLMIPVDIGCQLFRSTEVDKKKKKAVSTYEPTHTFWLNFRLLMKHYNNKDYNEYIRGELKITDPFKWARYRADNSQATEKDKDKIPKVPVQLGPYGEFEKCKHRFLQLPTTDIPKQLEYIYLVEELCYSSVDTEKYHSDLVDCFPKMLQVMSKFKGSETSESVHTYVTITMINVIRKGMAEMDRKLNGNFLRSVVSHHCAALVGNKRYTHGLYASLKFLAMLHHKKTFPGFPEQKLRQCFETYLHPIDVNTFRFTNLYARGFLDEFFDDLQNGSEFIRELAAFDLANMFSSSQFGANPLLHAKRGDYRIVQMIQEWKDQNPSFLGKITETYEDYSASTRKYIDIVKNCWDVYAPTDERTGNREEPATLLGDALFALFDRNDERAAFEEDMSDAEFDESSFAAEEIQISSDEEGPGHDKYRATSGESSEYDADSEPQIIREDIPGASSYDILAECSSDEEPTRTQSMERKLEKPLPGKEKLATAPAVPISSTSKKHAPRSMIPKSTKPIFPFVNLAAGDQQVRETHRLPLWKPSQASNGSGPISLGGFLNGVNTAAEVPHQASKKATKKPKNGGDGLERGQTRRISGVRN